jgi:hypothetical protein
MLSVRQYRAYGATVWVARNLDICGLHKGIIDNAVMWSEITAVKTWKLVYSEWHRATLKKEFNVHASVYRKNILIYVQHDAKLHSSFYLETALHVSGGTTTHHQERKQLYLQLLVFVTPLLLSAAIVEELEVVWVCCGWRTPPTAHSNHFQLFHDSGR